MPGLPKKKILNSLNIRISKWAERGLWWYGKKFSAHYNSYIYEPMYL
jgi:hypothetical protein